MLLVMVRSSGDLFGGFLTVEEGCGFLQSSVLGLDDEEVEEDTLEEEPDNIDEIVFPCNSIKSNRVDVLVEDERKGNGEVEDGEALGAELVWQNLDSVGHDERGEGEIVRGVVQEDERNDGVGGGLVFCLRVDCRTDRLEGEEEEHASDGGHEKDATADFVNER